MSQKNRRRPLRQFPLDPDLIVGLKKLSDRLHEPAAAIVRRAIRRELEREGVLKVAKVILVAAFLSSVSCVSPTSPSAKEWICTTQERCSYPGPTYQRTCRVDQYVSDRPCPATPIP
jgi:hypothetical protein